MVFNQIIDRVQNHIHGYGFRKTGRIFFLAIIVGIFSGLGAIFFYTTLEFFQHHLLDLWVGLDLPGPKGEPAVFYGSGGHIFKPYLLLLVLTAGGFLCGLITHFFAPEAAGHGTDAAIRNYHFNRGIVKPWVPIVKIFASVITLGTGGAGGKEGPIAQIGGGFGSYLADRLKLSDKDRRVLLCSGIAAGVGSIFKSPLAGALFAAEVLYLEAELEYEVIISATISSIIGYSIFGSVFGWNPIFTTPAFDFTNPLELGPYLVLAIFVSFGGMLFIKFFYWVHHGFERSQIHPVLRPTIGAFLLGLIAMFLPELLGSGYGFIQQAMDAELTIPFLLILVFGKMLATTLSIGSGGSGGVFGPSLVIGGSIGGVVGLSFHHWFPGLVHHPGSYVMVGMAGFFAGAANTPISTLLMVSEMTGNYKLIVPSMWVCTIAFLLMRKWSLYEAQVPSRLDSPAHKGDFIYDFLESITVQDTLNLAFHPKAIFIPDDVPLSNVLETFVISNENYYPVVNQKGELTGSIDLQEVRLAMETGEMGGLIITSDIAAPAVVTFPDEDLHTVLNKMTEAGVNATTVVKDETSKEPMGILTRGDLMAAYDREMIKFKKQ